MRKWHWVALLDLGGLVREWPVGGLVPFDTVKSVDGRVVEAHHLHIA